MEYSIFQVDAFADEIFRGNPACVVPLNNWLSDKILLDIAKENGVAETAFFIRRRSEILLRWFTPDIEMDLCGHATLATAHVIFTHYNYSSKKIVFSTQSGKIEVVRENDFYYLNLPAWNPIKSELPKEIELSLNILPKEVYKTRDYLLVYESQKEIESISINRTFFDKINLGCGGVIITSVGETTDFVSRFFTPQATILEDPVTGSAHSTLIPYWSSRIIKNKLAAIQLSQRGGKLICKSLSDRVIVGGRAVTFMKGCLYI